MKLINITFFFFLMSNCIIAQALFTFLPPEKTNIQFQNIIIETKEINGFEYEYLFNGGGVAIGDINNDGLSDIYFSGNMVPNKLFLNLGNLKFKDITLQSGTACEEGFKTGVAMADVNSDGFIDIYVCKSAVENPEDRRNILLINNGNNTFTNKAKEFGIDDPSVSSMAYFSDMDLDGDLDLFLLNHPKYMSQANNIALVYNAAGVLEAAKDTERAYVSNRYYEFNNGKFTDKTMAAGLGTYAFGLSAIVDDFNDDGYPDIYTSNDYHHLDYLFINNKNGTFTEKAKEYFKHFSYSSMGSDYADINNDGLLDLMVVDMLPESIQRQKQLKGTGNYDNFNKRVKYGFGHQYVKNVLQYNNGNHTFSDISYIAGVPYTEWSWAPLIADFDNDGYKDIYVTNGYLHDLTDMDYMVYTADSMRKELTKSKDPNFALSMISKMPSTKTINYFFKNNGNLTFANESFNAGIKEPSFSNGAAYADLDNDGDLDLIVNNLNQEHFVYQNNASDKKTNHYFRCQLKGSIKNKDGIGAIINIETADGKKQTQHFIPTKGFFSSLERFVHFGVGNNTSVNLTIVWPNKMTQIIINLSVDKVHIIDIANASNKPFIKQEFKPLFKDITKQTNVNHVAKEVDYIDFKLEPLLPHQFSRLGPDIAVADINGDKLDDFFIGGSKDAEGVLFMQEANGKFKINKQQVFALDKKYEDVGVAFFDADNDGDNDLIVVSGGNESPEKKEMYIPRLYMNNGKGQFSKSKELDNYITSGKAIAIDDFDKDGDNDIFIGGRIVPGHYGLMPQSFLLQNNNGHFTNITNNIPPLATIGMVTDAIWTDTDGDGWKELAIVGEWMPLTIFKNKNGKLAQEASIIKDSYGWWNTIIETDVNKDGLIDLIGGNLGFNSRYKASETYPISMTVSDFDNNGSTDCIISTYQQDGVSYPLVLRDNLLDQMNYLKKKYLRYKDFNNAKLEDIFTPEQLKKATTFYANNLQSTIFINMGGGNYKQQLLVAKAQISSANGLIAEDMDKDGKIDIAIVGNNYTTEVETGRDDAGIGIVLKNTEATKFKSLSVLQSGFYVPGDAKVIKKIMINNKTCFIVGKNDDAIQIIGYND
jgi:enediyne biosynthesis protein E4